MTLFICSNCGYGSASWLGRCPDCGQWKTFKEQQQEESFKSSRRKESVKKLTVTPLKKILTQKRERIKTKIFEFDRVLGGGFVPGEVTLLTGEPGVGKSTLLLQSLPNVKTLYISGEESAEQVKDRAERLNVELDNFFISDNLQVEGIAEGVKELGRKIDVLVIDSIQTIYSKDIEATAGSISQLKETAAKLIILAKKQKIAVILIGHITKEGEVAGPKTLEHMVDCVLNFEGERISQFRLLRAAKNRFGPTDEIGIFEMGSRGLKQVTNPLIFLDEKQKFEPGKVIIGVIEGKRPLFFEMQTLVSQTAIPVPRRVIKGLDYNKALLLLAVIKKHLNLPLDKFFDVYANIIGGFTVKSTAADLGFVASLLSSYKNVPLPKNSLYIGEVGLLGEVRNIYGQEKVIQEGRRLGFTKIFSSNNVKNIKDLAQSFYKKFFSK